MEGAMVLIPITAIVVPSLMIAWIVSVVGKVNERRLEALTRAQQGVMEKFGSAREFIDFLQTPGGMRYLDAFTMPKKSPSERILKSVTTGIVTSMVGLGLLGIAAYYGFDEEGPVIFGVLALSIGIGFLISAWVSTRLSRAWNLMGGTEAPQP